MAKPSMIRRIYRGPLAASSSEARRGFLYHATSKDNAHSIISGGLKRHRPWYGTQGQGAWPDRSRDRRVYFSPRAGSAAYFGQGAVFRVRAKHIGARPESGTGDWYTTRKVPARLLQVLGADGKWHRAKSTVRTQRQRAASRMNLAKARARARVRAKGGRRG